MSTGRESSGGARSSAVVAMVCAAGLIASSLPFNTLQAAPIEASQDLADVRAALDELLAEAIATPGGEAPSATPADAAPRATPSAQPDAAESAVTAPRSRKPGSPAWNAPQLARPQSQMVELVEAPILAAPAGTAAVRIDAIGQPTDGSAGHEITLSWPPFPGALEGYEVERGDGTIVALGKTVTTFTDTGWPAGALAKFSVTAIVGDGSRPSIGEANVVIPELSRNCSIVWTGATDSNWPEPTNWAPIVDLGTASPAPAEPDQNDNACVDTDESLPIVVDTANQAVGSMSSVLPDGQVSLSVAAGELAVASTLTLGAVELAGGTLEVKGAAAFGAASTTAPTLVLDGGTLDLAVNSTISGTISVTAATTTITSSGTTPTVTFPNTGNTTVVIDGDGGTIIGGGGITFQAIVAEIGNVNLAAGSNGGATLDTIFLDILPGNSLIDWGVDASFGVTIDDLDAAATITDLISLRSDTVYEGRFSITGGDLTLTQPITQFGDGFTFNRLHGGTLTLNGGAANDWQGVENLFNLSLTNAGLQLPGGLLFKFITVGNGTLNVDGDLSFSRDIELDFGGRIEATKVESVGAQSFEGSINVLGDAAIIGDVEISGDINMAVSDGEGDADSHELLIDGDLLLEATSGVRMVLNSDGSSNLLVTGTLTANGKLTVGVNARPDGRVDELLMKGDELLGDFDEVVVNDDDDLEVDKVEDRDEYRLRDPAPAECDDVPEVSGMPVGGCWINTSANVFQTEQRLGTDPFTIGAVEFELAPNQLLTLDFDAGRLTSTDDSRAVVAVAMSMPIVRENATSGFDEITRLQLGSQPLNDWRVTDLLALDLADLLGLPINGLVTIAAGPGYWNLDVPTKLPEFLDMDTIFDFNVEPMGLRDDQIGLDELEVVVGEFFGLTGIQLDWVSDKVWSILSPEQGALPAGFGQALALDPKDIGIDGTIDFDPVGAGGVINVRGMVIADLVRVPDFSIGFVRGATTDQWLFTGGETSVVRRLAFTYARNGALQSADMFLGDEAGASQPDAVANWGDWLLVDALHISTADAGRWAIAGRLKQPDVDFDGSLTLGTEGNVRAVELGFAGVELGPIARFDMDLILDVDAEQYTVAATLVGDGFDERSGSGYLRLLDGDLIAGQIDFDELPLGEIATLEDISIAYDGLARSFAFSGVVPLASGDPSSIGGQVSFIEGRMASADLTVDQLSFGLVTIDALKITFVAVAGEDRSTTFDLTGSVRGPIVNDEGTSDDVSGSMSWEDGKLIALSLDLPRINLGLASLNDVGIEYAFESGTAIFAGGGVLETADATTSSAASFAFSMRDDEMITGSVTAGEITLGELVSIDEFELSYNAAAPAPRCAALGGDIKDALWAVSGQTTTLDAVTSVEGCLAYNDGAIVAGSVDIGDLRVGALFTIADMTLSVQTTTIEEVEYAFGVRRVRSTSFTIDATWVGPGGTPTAIAGSMTIANGGLTQLELTVPLLQITNLIRLENLNLSFVAGQAWDDEADTSVALSGTLLNGPEVSTFAGSATFTDGRRLGALSIDVTDVDFGLFTLDELSFVYDGLADDTIWRFDGEFSDPNGTVAIDGDLVMNNGEVQSGSLRIPRLGLGGVVQINELRLGYQRTATSEAWSGGAAVVLAGGSAEAEVMLRFDNSGTLVEGDLAVDQLVWGDLIRIDDFGLRFNGGKWDVTGTYTPRNGPTSTVDGQMTITDGSVVAGRMELTGIRIGSLATISLLTLDVDTVGAITGWAATLELENGTTAAGAMVWDRGVLTQANFELGQIRAGGLFTIDDLTVTYDVGSIWAVGGSVTASGETTTVSGKLTFSEGQIVGGGLLLENFRFGPLDLEQLTIVAGTEVEVGGFDLDVGSICGVADTGVGGTRFGMSATMRVGQSDTISLGGRLRLDDGAITEGVFCGENIQITELATLEELTLSYVDGGTTETWGGSTTIRNNETPGNPFAAEFSMTFTGNTLTAATLTTSSLKFGDLLTLSDVAFSYVDDGEAVTWAVDATVVRPGPDGSITGRLDVSGGTIVGGSLQVSELTFGNAFTLSTLDIEYVGRRTLTDTPAEDASDLQFNQSSVSSTSCTAAPTGPNVPTGNPTIIGAESYFRLTASVTANGATSSAAGTVAFSDGRLSAFDINISCVGFGDWLKIKNLRLAYTDEGSYLIAARLGNADPDGAEPYINGLANFVDGRLVGGQLGIGGVSLGATELKKFDLTLGQQPDGTSQWALAVEVINGSDEIVSGGGSITIDDGRIVAGSLTIPEISIADLVEVRNLSLGFDSSQAGRLRIHGGAEVGRTGNPSALAVDVTFVNGRISQGMFSADRVTLFQMIPVSSFEVGYTKGAWYGSFGAEPESGSSGPSIEAAFEISGGRLVSGLIGFDGDGDGNPDSPAGGGAASASGSGSFAAFPLRAFYLRYCGPTSDAPFCSDVDGSAWDGKIRVELPTEEAPSLEAELRVRNGRFAAASLSIENVSIPIFAGVFLNSIEAALEIDPRFRFCGGLSLTAGSPGLTIIELGANVSVSEEFSDYPMSTPDGCELTESINIPDDVEPDYFRILAQGEGNLFPGNPLDIVIEVNGFVDLQTRGFLGVGGGIDITLINNILEADGSIRGSMFNANRVPAVHPDTGERLTGVHAQIGGDVGATVLGKRYPVVAFVASTVGFAACALNQFGVGKFWSGGGIKFTCNLGRFEIVVPGTASASPLTGPFAAPMIGAAPESVFTVGAGEGSLGVDAYSVDGSPDAILVSPDGTRYRETDSDDSDGSLVASSDNQRLFFIKNPVPGEWTVVAASGSIAISKVTTYFELPDAEVSGGVRPVGGAFELDYELSDIPGQSVMFVEREAGQPTIAALGRVASNRAESAAPLLDTGSVHPTTGQYTQTRSLETTGTTAGKLVFQPSGNPAGGEREIVAMVTQDGLPRTEIVIAKYTAPDATKSGAPTAVSATATASGATVTWAPPADSGGRQVQTYRISSTRGIAITAPFDGTSAQLTVPLMQPGETVTVFVEAYTSLGWGATGTATFTATTATGAQFSAPIQANAPEAPGSNPIVTEEFIPTAPPAVVPPTTEPPVTVPPTTQPPTPTVPAVPTVPPMGDLPTTGSSASGIGMLATMLALLGLLLIFMSRRRRAAHLGG